MNNKKLNTFLITMLISNSGIGWSTMEATTNSLKSDFKIPSHNWKALTANDLKGKHELFTIKQEDEHVFLYKVSPKAEMGIKEHDKWEEVIIINGSLDWLDSNGHPQQTLSTGAYVDRPPHVKHGPFRAGNEGCLMYVRMHG